MASTWDGFAGALAGALIGGATSAVIAWRVVVATQTGSDRAAARSASVDACLRLKRMLLDAEQAAEQARLTTETGARTIKRRQLFKLVTDAIELETPLLADTNLAGALSRLYRVVGQYVGLGDRRDAFVLDALRSRREAGESIRVEIAMDGVSVQARGEFCQYCAALRQAIDRSIRHKRSGPVNLPDPVWPDEVTPPAFITVDA